MDHGAIIRYYWLKVLTHGLEGLHKAGLKLQVNEQGSSSTLDSKDEAELALSNYQLGSEVRVYFIPKKPKYSCLVRGLD